MELKASMKTWPIHAKQIGRIELDGIAALSGSSATLEAWRHEIHWLRSDDRYRSVPIRDHNNIPRARYKSAWMKRLLECNVVAPIDPLHIRGHVNMFVVPEAAKKRFRSIKHTEMINVHCGRETLTPCSFPTKSDIFSCVADGDYFIALDFAAYYDQFELSDEVSSRMCFSHNGKFYRLKTLAMGQRQAVEIANSATQRMIDFPRRSTFCHSIIDNVIFVGKRDDVVHDAWVFVSRCKQVMATLNEIDVQTATLADVAKLARREGDWAGIHIDLDKKSVALTDKAVAKTLASWNNRSNWTWRDYAGHIGLLFWAWRILDIPMAELFDVLRFNSFVGRLMTSRQPPPRQDGTYPKNAAWDERASIANAVLPLLTSWTFLVATNRPRTVRPAAAPQLLIECDSSGIGYGYTCLHVASGEVFSWGAPWTDDDRAIHGAKLGKSVYSEPLGIRNCLRHVTHRLPSVRIIAVGTDNTVAEASFNRGFNSHSFHINRCVRLLECELPNAHYSLTFKYIPGDENLGDGPSRGGSTCKLDRVEVVDRLRRHLGFSAELVPGSSSAPVLG